MYSIKISQRQVTLTHMYFSDCSDCINGAIHLPILQQTKKHPCIYLGTTRIQVHTTRIQVYIYAYLKSTKTSPCVCSVYTSNEFALIICVFNKVYVSNHDNAFALIICVFNKIHVCQNMMLYSLKLYVYSTELYVCLNQ